MAFTKMEISCQKKDGMAELAKASVVHPRDPSSNFGSDRKYFLMLFVPNLNPNL
jgi:hypothetical protein